MNGITSDIAPCSKVALAVRPLVLLLGLAVAASSYFLFATIKGELAPVEDQGNIIVMFRGPEGATIEYTDAYAKKLEEIALAVPEADRVFVGGRQSDRLARARHSAPETVGRAQAHAAGDRPLDRAADGRRRRRRRLSEQSALARPEPRAQADQFRDPDVAAL